MKNILIVKTSAIGDIIQTLPCLQYLKACFPKSSIDWVVERSSADLLEACGLVDRVLIMDSKKWRKSWISHKKEIKDFAKILRERPYNLLFDLQGNTKSAFVTKLAKAKKKVGYVWDQVPEKPNFFVTNKHYEIPSFGNMSQRYLRLVQNYFDDMQEFQPSRLLLNLSPDDKRRLHHLLELGFQHPRIMICFGSKWKNKRLPKNTLKDLLLLIEEKLHPHLFFIYSNQEEQRFAEELQALFKNSSHAVGEMSLSLWQRFMEEVDLVIAMDSAALHLCATTKTPSFSFFGPTSSATYRPVGANHGSLQGSCPYAETFDKRCSYLRSCETGACIRDIPLDQLFQSLYSFWMSVSKSSEWVTS